MTALEDDNEHEKLYKEAIGEEAYTDEKRTDRQIARNNRAGELEAQGKIDEAIKIYEQLIAQSFKYPGPYFRLAKIYRKRKLYGKEIKALEKRLWVLENGMRARKEELRIEQEKNRTLPADDSKRKYELYLIGYNANFDITEQHAVDECKKRIAKAQALRDNAVR